MPSSATTNQAVGPNTSSRGHMHAVNLPGCIFAGQSVHGYGSLSYYLTGRGAFYYGGSYLLMANTNLSITVSA